MRESITSTVEPDCYNAFGVTKRSIPETWVTLHSGNMGNSFGPKGLSIGIQRRFFPDSGSRSIGCPRDDVSWTEECGPESSE